MNDTKLEPQGHVHGPGCNHDHDHHHAHAVSDPVRNPVRDVGRNDPCP